MCACSCMCVYIYIHASVYANMCVRECMCVRGTKAWSHGCLIFIGHLSKKSPRISGSFVGNDLQLILDTCVEHTSRSRMSAWLLEFVTFRPCISSWLMRGTHFSLISHELIHGRNVTNSRSHALIREREVCSTQCFCMCVWIYMHMHMYSIYVCAWVHVRAR